MKGTSSMKHLLSDTPRIRKQTVSICFALIVSALVSPGCTGSGSRPQYNVESYLLNYSAPSWEKPERLAASLKFNRFSIAAAYNTVDMIFRTDAYSIDTFNYSRWAVNPADMIADGLMSDLRASGFFQAVFSRHDTDDGRFILSGGIEEFYLRANKTGKTAVIGITLSLKDSQEKDTGKKMMFQKKYVREEALQEASPRGYALAASLAMQALSRQMTDDIYAAIKKTVP
jgi:ABC-type uncharacterized transport system auxiliary subunit